MKRCLLVFALPALMAAAPTPLVVGSVRDQYGAPIAGARITASGISARTDAQGTFALRAAGVESVVISCAYCQAVTLAVTPDEPVLALVRRYDAVAQDAPTDRDVAAVPYAHAESVAALRPFTVLETSSRVLPGAQLSDRGLSSRGALVVADGIPMYDVASNQSPFVAFPAYAVQRVSWLPPSNAFTYGDLAGGGTILAGTQPQDSFSLLGAAGSASALRAGQAFENASWSAGASSEPDDRRASAGGFFRFPLADDALDVTAIAAQDRLSPGAQHLDTSDLGVRIGYFSARENRVNASVTFDGGGYDGGTPRAAYSAKWSDVQAQAGVATVSRIQFFTDAGIRASSGYYETSGSALPNAAGAIGQTRIDMGAQTSGDRYSARLGFGAFDFLYAGGIAGTRRTTSAGIVLPSFDGAYAFDPHWSLDVQAGEAFALPAILEAFVFEPAAGLVYDRSQYLEETVNYGDLRRFRMAFTTAGARVSGLDNGTVHSAGISAAWQVAPALSLRAWLLRDNDFTQPYEQLYRFGAAPKPATVGQYWLTYESAGLRIDAIYRRDLLDYRTDPHLDAALSAPLGARWRIFAATQRRAGKRTVWFGIRATP